MTRKKVIVTGASGGIGKFLCERLAKEGFDLILLARTRGEIQKIAEHLESRFGGVHQFHEIDFSSAPSVHSATSWLQGLGFEISGLVVMPPQAPPTFDSLPELGDWADLFSRCFAHPVELIKGVVPLMGLTGRGKIVIVSGISSAQVLSHYATSNVLRCCWLAQAKTMAFALGAKNIHVNTVSLGGILTEKYQEGIAARGIKENRTYADQLANETDNVPLKKYGTPDEVSSVVFALLSDFSDHISGVNLLCDGGFTRAY
jgi:3-oxoacyl-[acyl-carrier protein] reductase